MTTTTDPYVFLDDDAPTERIDTVPPLADVVEHPCNNCGKEAGTTPTGRKRRHCDNCRSTAPKKTSHVRVTGNAQNLAAQAAKTLANVNTLISLGLAGLKFFKTAGAIAERNDDFEQAAYQALLTDPKLAQSIVSVGAISGKMSLGMAYVSLGMGIAPHFAMELRERKEASET